MKFRIALAAVALLVLGMSGAASAQTPTGTVVFDHGNAAGPAVDIVIYPFEGFDPLEEIPVAAGTTTSPMALPAGTHEYWVLVDDGLVHEGVFSISAGATTKITVTFDQDDEVQVVVSNPVDDGQTATPRPQTATPRPQTVTVPSRVDTGAGGATTDGARELVLGGLAAAVAVGALTFVLRRRTTA